MFNEGQVIGGVIRGLRAEFSHIVCIDDGSSDASVAEALGAGAHVIKHPINLGQGAALQTGLDFAMRDPNMTAVVTFDADGQHQVADAVAMVEKLRSDDLDVVFGSRFLDERTVLSKAKRLTLRTAARYSRLTTGMALTDAHNGLRVIDRSVIAKLRITQNRMAHASELVDLIGGLDIRWSEYPTHIVYTQYSKAKGQSLLNGVNILVELLIR